ncbi:hypothetical protein C5167_007045 [Papaver somniferum]|uniref:Uncharacterized protein n=1 Tax=Papaver somniferum TaxID=3469 RepID=A0A4Y7JI65_PAPSO|nr:hypothetical protein C5167_007045 [Papaver somniferum]
MHPGFGSPCENRERSRVINGQTSIEELQALSPKQQKEVSMLNARLAAAESMTHDVIGDLLAMQPARGSEVEEAQKQTKESIAGARNYEFEEANDTSDLLEERQRKTASQGMVMRNLARG